MQLQPRILIRDLPQSPVIENHIHSRIKKLNQYCDDLIRCDVSVEQETRNQNKGKLYNTRILISVPGEDLNVNHHIDEDVYISIRDAFNAARRQLKHFVQKQRRNVKHHQIPIHGYIERIFYEDGFGFIMTNGDEYYFSDLNVSYPAFEHLKEGMEVTFIGELAGDSLQAKRVTAGKHHRGIIADDDFEI